MEKSKQNNQQQLFLFAECTLFSLFFYGLKSKLSFQPDVYLSLSNRRDVFYWGYVFNPLGRPVASILSLLISQLHLTYEGGRYYLNIFESLFFMSLACYRFGLLLIRKMPQYRRSDIGTRGVIWLGSLSCIILGNLFSAEALLYPGMHYFLSIWLCVEAVIAFVDYTDNSKKRSLPVVFLCLYLVSGIYQTNVSLYVILVVLFALLDATQISEFVKRIIVIGGIYTIVMLPQIILLKIVFRVPKATASSESRTIVQTAENYAPTGVSSKDFILQRIPYGIWVYAILCVLLGVLLVYSVIKSREYIELLKGAFLVCTVLVMGLLPYFAKVGGDYKPRVYYPLATMLGILLFYGEAKGYTGVIGEKGGSRFFCIGILAFMLVVQWRSFLDIYVTQYLTDREDKYISEMIGEVIRCYEEESGEKIRYVTFYEDAERTKYLENRGWCLSQRAYDASWSRLPALNYWLDENYQDGKADDELNKYYSSRNWDVFSDRQIVFIGDCAHICVY